VPGESYGHDTTMDHQEYETIVQETIDALPDQIREQLKNVAIVIEAEAPPQKKGVLLGLYQGIPLTAWGRESGPYIPDKISLFQDSIERVAKTPEDIPALIRETLWHEIAHFFGFDHDHIHHMEERWRTYRDQKKS
jgi:predicted Zn-dependent protease with MMP-like domain